MRSIARWCVVHRRIVVVAWVVALVAVTVGHASVGSDFKNSFSLHGTQSSEAQSLLQRAAPKAAGDRETVVFAVANGRIGDAAPRARVEADLRRIARLPMVAAVQSPFTAAGGKQISKSGQIAFAPVTLRQVAQSYDQTAAKRFVDVARSANGGGLQIGVTGQVAEQSLKQGDSSAAFGAIAALIVLLVVFGSVLAALLPLVTAGVALGVGIGLIGLLSHLLDMANFSSELALLIGLGVGVDYALFIVTRARQGLQAGRSVEDAIVDAVDTSGRAVMFAGITVCIALLGMFALGVSLLYGVGIAAALVVVCTVLSALTLLPALLGFLGPRALGRRGMRQLARTGPTTETAGRFWQRWPAVVQARPALLAAGAVVLMAVIAIPFFSLRLGSSDQGSDPSGSTTRIGYDLLARGFGPGYNGPLQLVARVNGSGEQRTFAAVLRVASRSPDVAGVTAARILPAAGSGHIAAADVYPTGSPQAVSTSHLLTTLRDHVIPRTTSGSGVHVLVGGQTAIFADFATVLTRKLPLFIGIVVLLSFLLLAAVFRSLVIPLMAAAMNMFSAGAAFGVLVAVFQWGWADRVLGIDQTGPIEAFIPVMLFAILFGLSMDYEVFLVSRIYEEWHRTGDNRTAIARGLRATGRPITAAATIMVLVFVSFVFGDTIIIKMFGLGLAAAILLDALVVRMALVPALMTVVGRFNWALPGAVDRVLPHLNVEGSSPDASSGAPEPERARARDLTPAG